MYRHTNRVNGKVYIGMTSKRPKDRWQNGNGYSGQSLFWNAIQKYGWDAFDHEVLHEGLSKSEAEHMERELILHYRSNERDFGYNMADGGGVNRGYKLSDVTRKRLSEAHKGRQVWNKGLSGYTVPSARGKKRSAVTCKRMSDNRPKLAVLQYSTSGELLAEFASMHEASKATGVSTGSISGACSGRQRTAGGYVWTLKRLEAFGVRV